MYSNDLIIIYLYLLILLHMKRYWSKKKIKLSFSTKIIWFGCLGLCNGLQARRAKLQEWLRVSWECPVYTALCHIWKLQTLFDLGASGCVMVCKLDEQNFKSDFESHGVPRIYGLVSHLEITNIVWLGRLMLCNGLQARQAKLQEWLRVSWSAPYIRPCVTSGNYKHCLTWALMLCNGLQARRAKLQEWLRVSWSAPYIRHCVTSGNYKHCLTWAPHVV